MANASKTTKRTTVAIPKKNGKSMTKVVDVNVIGILDMSGSMSGKETETRGGWNSFIEQAQADQKEEGGKVTISLTCFDTEFIQVYAPTDVQNVRPIGPAEYTPRGNTALLDAIGKTISAVTYPKEEKVMVIITTDGQENSSYEWIDHSDPPPNVKDHEAWKAHRVKELIEAKEAEGWEFMFLGVGVDAFQASQSFSTAAMRGSTVTTPGTAAAAAATSSVAVASGYQSLRKGSTLGHAVADAYNDPTSAFGSLIDRSVPDQRGVDPADSFKARLNAKTKTKVETTTSKLRKLRQS